MQAKTKISVIHPTCRPEIARQTREEWFDLAKNPDSLEYLLCIDSKKDLMYDITASNYNDVAKYQYVSNGGLFDSPNRILHNEFSGDMMAKWTSS